MSGSIFPSDQGGVFGVVLGLIGMILFGVLVTLLADGSIRFGGGRTSDPEAAVLRQEARIKELTAEIQLFREAAERKGEREIVLTEAATARALHKEIRAEEAGHRATAATARQAITALRNQFASYRDDHRRQLWRDAAGTRLEDFTSVDGKTYREVTITGISEVGLAIRHKAGMARLTAHDLPGELRERFLLDTTESTDALAEEREARRAEDERRRERMTPPAAPPRDPPDRPSARREPPSRDRDEGMDAATRARVAELHRKLAVIEARQNRVQTDLSIARSQAGGSGRDRSVPGSLDTWEERAAKLQRLSSQLAAQFGVIEAELIAKDPAYRRRRDRDR